MNNDWKPTEINEGQPTNWEPRKQHPEEVADGLRNAFRQAMKDGVMDATPYLKQMTFTNDIQKTEAEIKVLQKKLELLKEIETHKSQPRMNLQFTVKGEVVSYNDEVYYRLDFAGMNHNWYKKKTDNGVILVKITDGETHRLLEGVWFNDVKKGKYDDVVDEHKSPVEEAYKDWWGIYPELENDTEYDETRWSGFQAGYEAAQLKDVGVPECPDEPESNEWRDVALKFGRKLSVFLPYSYDELSPNTWFRWVVFTYDNYMKQRDIESGFQPTPQTPEPYCPDEPPEYDEVEWDEKDNPKPMDEVMDRLVKKYQAQKLRNMLKVQLDYDGMVCDDIVDIVEDWLPQEQSASGSQNTFVECSVEGYNDCVRQMKEMLR
jgi:hypothetical protein